MQVAGFATASHGNAIDCINDRKRLTTGPCDPETRVEIDLLPLKIDNIHNTTIIVQRSRKARRSPLTQVKGNHCVNDKAAMFVAQYAIKIVLFALAQKPPGAHISSCLLGILSQDF
jgi:hypothetical protein